MGMDQQQCKKRPQKSNRNNKDQKEHEKLYRKDKIRKGGWHIMVWWNRMHEKHERATDVVDASET